MPDGQLYAPDAPERLRPKKVFVIDWSITGQLEITASSADEAWRKALRFAEQDLAVTGQLHMEDPEEKGSVQ